MTTFQEVKLIDRLIEQGKLNPIYFGEGLEDLISICPTVFLTKKMFYYSIGIEQSKLSEHQLEALVSDIRTLKVNGIWSSKEEQKALEECKKELEIREQYKKLSHEDKEKYDREFLKQLDKFSI